MNESKNIIEEAAAEWGEDIIECGGGHSVSTVQQKELVRAEISLACLLFKR